MYMKGTRTSNESRFRKHCGDAMAWKIQCVVQGVRQGVAMANNVRCQQGRMPSPERYRAHAKLCNQI